MPLGDQPLNDLSAVETLSHLKQIYNLQCKFSLPKEEAIETAKQLFNAFKVDHDVTPGTIQEMREILNKIENKNSGGLDRMKQVYRDWHGKSETFSKKMLPETKDDLENLRHYVSLAEIPYSRAQNTPIQGISKELTKNLSDALDASLEKDLNPSEKFLAKRAIPNQNRSPESYGSFIDPRSGLTAHIAVDQSKKEVYVIFGGTSAGLSKRTNDSTSTNRHKYKFITIASQWISNIKTGLGIKSHSLAQANNLTSHVVQLVHTMPVFKDGGYTVRTIGHSKGSSEAVYAALSQDPPIHAVGFSSADLGSDLVRRLPKDSLIHAKDLITHYHVKADPIANLRFIIPSLRPLGHETVIPATNASKTPLNRHTAFASHINLWIDKQLNLLQSNTENRNPSSVATLA